MPGYISELYYAGGNTQDWIEIAVPAGTDVSGYSLYVYEPEGTVGYGPLPLGTVQSTSGGHDVYVIDAGTAGFGGFDVDEGVALVDDIGTVLQFLSVQGEVISATNGPAVGMDSTSVGTSGPANSLQTDDGGSTYYSQTDPNKGTIPCYAVGTLIETPSGPHAVETLRVGALISTLDRGAMPVRWLRRCDQVLAQAAPDARPVLIRAGALGQGRPARDLVVSPQHRILAGRIGQLSGRFDRDCLVPAKALTGLPGIRFMHGKKRITWYHFALDSHAVVTANGCWSESLLLGPMVTAGLSGTERRRLAAVFGPAPSGRAVNGDPARAILSVGETRVALSALLATV